VETQKEKNNVLSNIHHREELNGAANIHHREQLNGAANIHHREQLNGAANIHHREQLNGATNIHIQDEHNGATTSSPSPTPVTVLDSVATLNIGYLLLPLYLHFSSHVHTTKQSKMICIILQ
jgi:hypothetical protein